MSGILLRPVATVLLILAFCCGAHGTRNYELQIVFHDNSNQFTGVAVSRKNRIFLSYPNWLEGHKYSVVELLAGGRIRPFPDENWNSWKPGEPGGGKFVCVQALYVDGDDFLWIVDPANPQFKGVVTGANKLVRINLKTGKVERVYTFDEAVAGASSYLNDVRIDTKNKYAFLTDSAEGAIIALDLKTGRARRFLAGHSSTRSDPGYLFRVKDEVLKDENGPLRINADGIALTPDGRHLYYKPLTDRRLFRIETKYLRGTAERSGDVEKHIEYLGEVSSTDGMEFDGRGNLYLGDIESGSLVRYTKAGKKEHLISDDRLLWPDSYAFSKDGYLYVTCSQIQNMPRFNNGKSRRILPYALYKLKIP